MNATTNPTKQQQSYENNNNPTKQQTPRKQQPYKKQNPSHKSPPTKKSNQPQQFSTHTLLYCILLAHVQPHSKINLQINLEI